MIQETNINPIHLLNHQIIRDLPFGVVVVDQGLKICDWNSWMDRYAGIPRAETQGKCLTDYFPDLIDKGLVEKILSVFETGKVVKLSYQDMEQFFTFDPNRAPARALRMVQDTEIRPLFDAEAEVAMACIIVKDFTEHVHRLKELARVNEELKEANQIKTEFLQTTSHELRTPLTAILGFVDLLENDLADSPEEEKEFLGNIRSSASHLLELINDILTAAKLQAKKVDIVIEPISLAEILTEAHAILHPVAKNKGLKFTLDVVDEDSMILADYQKFKQVLFNVIGNAIKFTEDGFVRIRSSVGNPPDHVVIEVQDSGIGIAPEKIHLVFEQFRQADPSATRKYGGTGLGMPISKSLMELMKGTISIRSEGLGKGSTVTMTLPLEPNP